MVLFKSCPRCKGDLALEEVPGETDLVCIQCGFRTAVTPDTAPVTVTKRAPVRRAA